MGRIAEEEREKLQVRLDKNEQIFCVNRRDFIPQSRKYECTNGTQTIVVWAFFNFVENMGITISNVNVNYHFVMENGQNYSQNCLYNTNKFLSVYSLVKVAAWQSSNIGCFFCYLFLESHQLPR